MMFSDAVKVKQMIRSHLQSSEMVSAVLIAGEGEIFDPADLDLWIRESYPRLTAEIPFQGVRMITGKLLLEVFARRDRINEMERLLQETDSLFSPETMLHEDSMSLQTYQHTYTGTVSEGAWLRSGVTIPFSAW